MGWSGGGSNTLNALFRKPELYHVGIAVVPKPQPHLYNAWFQEIYMRTPEVNPDGYRKSAPIHFAEGLRGRLLIIHGTGENNTHLEIAEGLVDRLIELGKPFELIWLIPVATTVSARAMELSACPHTHGAILLEHLPPGPR